jgi:DNA uptake protein ComE-like DNA-binding protein
MSLTEIRTGPDQDARPGRNSINAHGAIRGTACTARRPEPGGVSPLGRLILHQRCETPLGEWRRAVEGGFAAMLAIGLASVATAHAFVLRHELLGEHLSVRSGHTDAERLAVERIRRREYARRLLHSDPLLAYELRIGRPDLPRDFDDGGLIDVNHASAGALTRLPEINEQMAAQIVTARESVGGFSSVDDMSVLVGCAPPAFDRLEDFLVFAD